MPSPPSIRAHCSSGIGLNNLILQRAVWWESFSHHRHPTEKKQRRQVGYVFLPTVPSLDSRWVEIATKQGELCSISVDVCRCFLVNILTRENPGTETRDSNSFPSSQQCWADKTTKTGPHFWPCVLGHVIGKLITGMPQKFRISGFLRISWN